MKTILSDDELQKLSDNMKIYLTEKYKDEIEDVPDHIVQVLCQNYICNLKNNNIDINELFDKYNICDKVP